MSGTSRAIFWTGFFLALAALLYLLHAILAPFLAGVALAYILNPAADALERLKIPRALAAFLLTVLAFIVVGGIFLLILPPLVSQSEALAQEAPFWLEDIRNWIAQNVPKSDVITTSNLSALMEIGESAENWAAAIVSILLGGGAILMKALSFLVLTPITTIYLLRDWNGILQKLRKLLPRKTAPFIEDFLTEADSSVSAFLRGQISICLILGFFYATAFTFLGLDFGLLVGIFSGLISFIPYAGAAIGSILAVSMALVQFWPSYLWGVAALAICLTGQTLESYALTPWLVGNRVGLHPLWILLALSAFGSLWGLTGMILAIPAAATIGIAIRRAVAFYMRSGVYLQETRARAGKKI